MTITEWVIERGFQTLKRIVGPFLLVSFSACGGSGEASLGSHTNDPIAHNEAPYQKLEFVSGQLGGWGNTDGAIGRFTYPIGVAVNADGLLYVNDELGQRLRTIDPSGLVTSWEKSSISESVFSRYDFVPSGDGVIALDSVGDMYSVGSGGCHIRRMTPNRVTSVFAGQSVCGYLDGERSVAQFSTISSIVIDAYDNIYVADRGNYLIRKINMAGVVSTLAGKAGVAGTLDRLDSEKRSAIATNMSTEGMLDGTGDEARFLWPLNLAADRSGTVYVADGYHILRKVSSKGEVSRVTCKDEMGHDVLFFAGLSSMVTDDKGNLFITDTNKIRKLTPDGSLLRFVGGDEGGWKDGQGMEARFEGYIVYGGQWMPGKLAIDKANNLFFADSANHTVRKISPSGTVTTIGGKSGEVRYEWDLDNRVKMGTDALGNVYVNEEKISPSGEVSYVGSTDWRFSSSFTGARTKDGTRFWFSGTTIFKIDPKSMKDVLALAGATCLSHCDAYGIKESRDGTGMSASFIGPIQLVVDSQANLFVIEKGGPRAIDGNYGGALRKVDSTGLVMTIAGSLTERGYENGAGSKARFNGASSLAIDRNDQLYIADKMNHVIRKVTKDGVVSLFAGTPSVAGSRDGDGLGARFNLPEHLVIDSIGNLYVADNGNFLIRKITPTGVVSTIAGRVGSRGSLPGTLPANLSHIYGMTIDDKDNLYLVSEASVLRISK